MVNSSVELAMHDTLIAEIVKKQQQRHGRSLYKAVQIGQDMGHISKSNSAKTLARFIFNNYSGIRVLARAGEKDKKVYDDILKAIFSLL